MESSNGSASVTPIPRNAARREICFLAMNISFWPLLNFPSFSSLSFGCYDGPVGSALGNYIIGRLLHLHLERRTLDDTHQQRRELVVVLGSFAHNCSDGRHVVILDAPAERIGHQLFGEHADENFRPGTQ